jgi:uncharacterized DUF497 family protein
MRYTWDNDKNRRNIEQHGIAFEDAKQIFDSNSKFKILTEKPDILEAESMSP